MGEKVIRRFGGVRNFVVVEVDCNQSTNVHGDLGNVILSCLYESL